MKKEINSGNYSSIFSSDPQERPASKKFVHTETGFEFYQHNEDDFKSFIYVKNGHTRKLSLKILKDKIKT
jgi:hypothetical protein